MACRVEADGEAALRIADQKSGRQRFLVGALADFKMLDGGWKIWLPRWWVAGLRQGPLWTKARIRLTLFIGCQ